MFTERPRLLLAAGLVLALAGCQPTVREDRTITLGPDGRAAFQHGRNGVFVTDPATGQPVRVYQPDPDDLAVGPPTWDPAGRRMVFAVARAADGTRYDQPADAPADGRRYPAVPVRYTCWLCEPDGAGWRTSPLFEAGCGHAGAVAAGLVVCWHPDGGRLDYVDRDGPTRHRLYTIDPTTRAAEPVPLPPADLVIPGASTGGGRFALLAGGREEGGLWVEEKASGGWWRVPDSAPDRADLGELRRRLPRWSRDGTRLAFLDGPNLRVCETATRQTRPWFKFEDRPEVLFARPADAAVGVHWHPDGTRVGVLDGTRLGLVGPDGWAGELTDAPVTEFAGWDATGGRMAYVTLEPLPYQADLPGLDPAARGRLHPHQGSLLGALWATLVVPNPSARTAVRFADADGGNRRTAVSGLRATFPHWSATDYRLSAWLTVEPPYRLAAEGVIGMPPGDPAAVIDPDTGGLDWLPVSGTEHAQIAHAELRAGRLDAALRRFDEAAAGLPAGGKADWMFFRAVALEKAGRVDEARAALARFESPAPGPRADTRGLVAFAGQVAGPWGPAAGEVIRPRHRFAAEAFVSLEMAGEGADFLRREAAEARTDRDRLSALLALGQVLLLADRPADFAGLVADDLLPLAGRVLPTAGPEREAVGGSVALTVLPLAVGEFAGRVPTEVLRRVGEGAAAWPSRGDDTDLVCQLVLRTVGRRLGDRGTVDRAEARLAGHPGRAKWNLPAGGEVDLTLLLRFRATYLLADYLREAFGSDLAPRPSR